MSVQLNIIDSKESLELTDENFGAEFKQALIHQVVTAYMAGGRSGTSAQKNRSAVSGGGKKPWRQKGTGRARAGTIRNPIFVGGGQTFARSTRDYSQKINRKMYRGAMRSILSELARQQRIVVAADFDIEQPKTREMAARLNGLGIENGLIVLNEVNSNVELSVRNIPNIEIATVKNLNPVSLVAYDTVLITAEAAKAIDEKLS